MLTLEEVGESVCGNSGYYLQLFKTLKLIQHKELKLYSSLILICGNNDFSALLASFFLFTILRDSDTK